MNKLELEQDINSGLSIRKIAEARGVSFTAAKYWVNKYGLKSKFHAFKSLGPPICKECREDDPAKFYGDRKAQCKACQIKNDVKIGIRKKLKAIAYMGGKCACCGYNRHYSAIHFHHLDPKTKEDWGSIRGWGWKRLQIELHKCVMVCANCHSEIHAGFISDKDLKPGPAS